MKEAVYQTILKAYKEKLVAGTSGNVSTYDRENDLMAITPSGLDYSVMRPCDIVIMKLDGTMVEGNQKPSSEWRLHAEIYNGFDDANAVIHTHSPRATSFSVVHETIPLILIEMVYFLGGDVPLADFAMPGTSEVGLNAVKAMKNRNSCLLANHGVVAFGKDLNEAYLRAVYVEDAAAIYHFARQLGTPILVPDKASLAMREKCL